MKKLSKTKTNRFISLFKTKKKEYHSQFPPVPIKSGDDFFISNNKTIARVNGNLLTEGFEFEYYNILPKYYEVIELYDTKSKIKEPFEIEIIDIDNFTEVIKVKGILFQKKEFEKIIKLSKFLNEKIKVTHQVTINRNLGDDTIFVFQVGKTEIIISCLLYTGIINPSIIPTKNLPK